MDIGSATPNPGETDDDELEEEYYEHYHKARNMLHEREKQTAEMLHDAWKADALTIQRLKHVKKTYVMCARAMAAALVEDMPK